MDWLTLIVLMLTPICLGFWFCCCVVPGCTLFTEFFTRADAADPGAGWNVVSGSWPIVSNTMQTSSSNALILCVTEYDDMAGLGPADGYAVQVSFGTLPADQDVKVIVNYTDDSNHHYALIRKTGTLRCVQFYEVNGGTTTWLGGGTNSRSSGATDVALIAITKCLFASIDLYDPGFGGFIIESVELADLPLTSPKWGFGTGTLTDTISFDNVSLSRIRDAAGTVDDCTPLGCPGVCNTAHGMGRASDLTCKHEQVSGSWTSFNATPSSCFSASPIPFYQTSDSNAVVVTNQSEYGMRPANYCSVGATSHQPLRAILGYVDNDNYYYAEPVFGGFGDWCMTSGDGVRLYQVVGGTHNLLGEQLGHTFTDNCFTISIRFCHNWIHASAGGAGFGGFALPQVWVPHTTPDLTGTRAGIGSGSGGVTACVWVAPLRDDGVNGDGCTDCGTSEGNWCLGCGDADGIPSHTAEVIVSGSDPFCTPTTAFNGTFEAVNRFGCQWIYCYPGTTCGSAYRLVVAYNSITDQFDVRLANPFGSGLIGSSAAGISCVNGTFTVTNGAETVQVTFNGD